MRSFVRDFFAANGCKVTRDTRRRLEVRLNKPLGELFGRDKLAMAFQAKDADERTELVTHGSYVMDAIHAFLQDRGWKAFVSLAAQAKFTVTQAGQHVSPQGCTLGRLKRRRKRWHHVHFHVKVSYLSDERVEDVVSVRVDEAGRATGGMGPEQIALLPTTPTERGFLAKTAVMDRFRTAAAFVEREARKRAGDMQRDILERLAKGISRIKGYYERQMDEMLRRRSDDQSQADLAEVEAEMAMKLRETTDNHRLRVVLKLLSLTVVERPVAEFTADLTRGEATGSYTLTYDLAEGQVAYPPCPLCGKDMAKPALCDQGHVVCSECLLVCAQCGRSLCSRCGIGECVVCDKPVCPSCSQRCLACTGFVCADHVHTCCACGRETCANCSTTCASCHKVACLDHVRECAVCGQPVCHNCQTTCGACGQVFCRDHAEVCRVCGQTTCANCIVACGVCHEPVCASHNVACSVCGATGCSTHFVQCSACEAICCEAHGTICSGCGEWTCNHHLVLCGSCREPYCPQCFDEERYCTGCMALLLNRPDAEYATYDLVSALSGKAPTTETLTNWRVYTTTTRHIFMAQGRTKRWLIVTDHDAAVVHMAPVGPAPTRRPDDDEP